MEVAKAIRGARSKAGLTQRALAQLSGITQPSIAAYESGRVVPTAQTLDRLFAALRLRPSQTLAHHRDEVIGMISKAGGHDVRVFGSVARLTDHPGSDVDLLVRLPGGTGLFELVDLEQQLEELLGVPVDLVDDRGSGRVIERARAQAVSL